MPRRPVEPFDPKFGPTLRSWERPGKKLAARMRSNVALEMGWGRLLFGHTFATNQALADCLRDERPHQRDIAFYLRDPHVVLSIYPHELFLDPSHTYRLWGHAYRSPGTQAPGFNVRPIVSRRDVEEINRIYLSRGMVLTDVEFVLKHLNSRTITWLVAEDASTGEILGTITGVDHALAFKDPENGASLWCLAVDPQAHYPGVGSALVTQIIERFLTRGRAYIDLSVMHDNEQAIALYRKLGFERVPVFCVKHRNAINEPLFAAAPPEARLNPYARIIVNAARQRGVLVEVLDEEASYFRLHFAGRSVTCRESLTELTSAIAMSRCDDKRVTLRILEKVGLNVPQQQNARGPEQDAAFLARHRRIVVKPARGEQGAGISVDVREEEDLRAAVEAARRVCADVILEQFVEGTDLRVVLINYEVVAAAIRKPAAITGTGQHTIEQLIEKQSRRRMAATGGESRIPMDDETLRCVRASGHELDAVLAADETIAVRKTANLHTGGTIHDVTAQLHPVLAEASIRAARAIEIPVTGLDLMVPDVAGPDYWIIEANERPGLANHEPQPTAERFIDFLFPQTQALREEGRL